MNHSFVCVGFPKCATTTLDAILRQHPQIGLPCHKENSFFARDDLFFRGIHWYEKRFYSRRERLNSNKIYGEINPSNVANGNKEKNILETFGKKTKLIYIIRNPVDAVFSFFKQEMEDAAVYDRYEDNIMTENSFDEFVERFLYTQNREDYEKSTWFMLYKYGKHMATVLKYVPVENICVILFEDYIKDVEGETKKILSFIGADADVPLNYDIKENVGDRVSKGRRALKASRKKYYFWNYCYVPYFPYMGEKIERMMNTWYWNIRMNATMPVDGKRKRIGIHKKTREILMEYYQSDVELLDKTLKTNYGKRWGFI